MSKKNTFVVPRTVVHKIDGFGSMRLKAGHEYAVVKSLKPWGVDPTSKQITKAMIDELFPETLEEAPEMQEVTAKPENQA